MPQRGLLTKIGLASALRAAKHVKQARAPQLHDGEHSTGAFCTGTKLEQL